MKRGNKEVIAISIKNKTYYINLLLVDAVGVKNLQIKHSYEKSDAKTQEDIKEIIRDIILKNIEPERINTQSIEDEIFMNFLQKSFKKELLSLDK